ncbi:MAG: hypothetical protein AAF184_25580 [Pseudomonadota bacterium]
MATRASTLARVLVALLVVSPLGVSPLHAQALLADDDSQVDPPACNDHEDPRQAVASGTFPRPCSTYYYPYPEGPRFSSLYFWGDTGWYSVGSGLSDLFPLVPGQSRYPYPAIPPGFRIVPRSASTRTFAARPLPSSRAQPSGSGAQAPWAAAARRPTNPQQWRFDEAGPSAANARALTVSRAGASSQSLAAAVAARASGSRQRVYRTSAARASNPRYRQRH